MRHPQETVDKARELYEAPEANAVAAIAKDVGIAESTLTRWAREGKWVRHYATQDAALHRKEIADKARARGMETRLERMNDAMKVRKATVDKLLEIVEHVDAPLAALSPKMIRALGGVAHIMNADLRALDAHGDAFPEDEAGLGGLESAYQAVLAEAEAATKSAAES